MGLSRRKFTKEFKQAAIQRLESGSSVAEVARAFEVNPNTLHRWRREFQQGTGNAFPGLGKRRWEEGRAAELERKIGQQVLEIDFLKACLQRIEEQRMVQALTGKPQFTPKIREEVAAGPAMTVERMTGLAGVSRSSFAGCHAEDRAGISGLRMAAHAKGTAQAWLGGQSQAGQTADAGRLDHVVAHAGLADVDAEQTARHGCEERLA